ncbi:MAG: hypothetical protein GKR77_03770 [Legionellales bacterium]|nr:hypothetical protein [Legionellales bacterium]
MGWGLVAILIAGLMVWLLFRYAKSNPQAFSKENLSKSFFTMGVLAILLIAFIGLCILLLNTN